MRTDPYSTPTRPLLDPYSTPTPTPTQDSSMVVHDSIGLADRAQAKIIPPAAQGSIEFLNQHLDRFPIGFPSSPLADFLADGADSLGGRSPAHKGPSIPWASNTGR